MGLKVGKPGVILRDWATAIRDLPSNPLPARWAIADQRRIAAKSWFKANPGLFTIGLIISLVLTAYIVVLILRMAAIGPAYTAQVQANALLSMGVSALLVCGFIFTLCWVLSAVYRLSEFSLGLLSLHQGRHQRPGLDDETILAGFAPQEVLAAAGLQMLRIMLMPLIAFCALVAFTLAFLLVQSNGSLLSDIGNWTAVGDITPYAVWWVAGSFLRLLLHGLVATLIMGYFLVALGMNKHPLWTLTGSTGHVILHAVWFIGSLGLLLGFSGLSQSETNGFLVSLSAGLLGAFTLGALVSRFESNPRLRRFRILIPAIFVCLAVCTAAGIIFLENSSYAFTFGGIKPEFSWAGNALAILNLKLVIPDQLIVGLGRVLDESGRPFLFFEWWRMPLMVTFQLLYLGTTAEFARQVVVQRLSGEVDA